MRGFEQFRDDHADSCLPVDAKKGNWAGLGRGILGSFAGTLALSRQGCQ